MKNQSPSLNNDRKCAATSENFLTKAASAIDLKSQHNIQNILIDDKNSNSFQMNNDGNSTKIDSGLKGRVR